MFADTNNYARVQFLHNMWPFWKTTQNPIILERENFKMLRGKQNILIFLNYPFERGFLQRETDLQFKTLVIFVK